MTMKYKPLNLFRSHFKTKVEDFVSVKQSIKTREKDGRYRVLFMGAVAY